MMMADRQERDHDQPAPASEDREQRPGQYRRESPDIRGNLDRGSDQDLPGRSRSEESRPIGSEAPPGHETEQNLDEETLKREPGIGP
jgi:hypothetical protein